MTGVRNRTRQPELLRSTFIELMKGVCTSIPGHILTFDPDTQLAQVQVGIQRVDINDAVFEVAPIIETPVYFPGGDEFYIEYQIDPGCDGDILFSQRCIDGWVQSGGIAANPIGRFHNMQDAFFLPGFRPIPKAITGFQNNGVRLRNKTGSQFAWLKNDGSIFVENGSGHIRLGADGIVTINGVTITPESLVSTPNDMKAGDISLKTHRTSGVSTGTGTSGGPVV